MAQFQGNNQNSNASQQPQGNAQQQGGGISKLMLFAIIGILVIVVIALVVYFALSSVSTSSTTNTTSSVSTSGTPVTTQTASLNSTPIEMSSTQAELLLRSGLSQYSAYDLFKPTSPTNITDLETVVPQLYDNATSGWVTYAAGSNATANASIEYVVINTNYPIEMASALNNATLYDLPMSLETANSGTVNGLTYTYEQYVNATASFQTVSGYKNNYIVGVTINSYPVFTMNETSLVDTVANVTP